MNETARTFSICTASVAAMDSPTQPPKRVRFAGAVAAAPSSSATTGQSVDLGVLGRHSGLRRHASVGMISKYKAVLHSHHRDKKWAALVEQGTFLPKSVRSRRILAQQQGVDMLGYGFLAWQLPVALLLLLVSMTWSLGALLDTFNGQVHRWREGRGGGVHNKRIDG